MKKICNVLVMICCVTLLCAQTDRSVRPAAAPAKEIEIKDAEIFTLPNGLKVFVVEDHRTPIVYYSLQLDVTPALEGDKAGLGDLLGAVMGTATKNRSKVQLNKEIDLIGAQINVGNRGGFGSGLKKYESTMLELLSDMILNPLFTQEELDLVKGQAKSGLEYISSDPGQICDRISKALAFGSQYPKGEVETLGTIERISIDDLYHFYNTYFAPNVTRLAIVGDITLEQAKANVQHYFGAWKSKEAPKGNYVIPTPPKETKVAMFHKDGAVQSSINLSYPLPYQPGMADFEAAAVANHIFGGGMSGRLFLNLRETHSYTYGIYSFLHEGALTGLFELSSGRGAASVKAAATDSAFVQILFEMDNMINKPITQEELNAAKAYFAGSFGRSLQQSSTIAGFAMLIDKYNLPNDYYKNFLKRIDALTVADIQAAAGKYLKPKNAWIIVVGDKEHADGLKQFAANNTVQFYDINANPTAAPETKTADIGAAQLLNKYVEAIGGAAAIAKITDYAMTATMSMMGQVVDMTKLFLAPHYSLTTMSMGGMVIQKAVFDGVTLKSSGMAGNQEVTAGEEFNIAKAEAAVCPEMNFIKNGYTLTVKGIDKIGDTDVYVLDVDKGSVKATYYFDAQTFLIVRSSLIVDTPQGEVQQISDFSDYRAAGGLLFPYAVFQKVPAVGMETKMTVTEVKVNTGLTAGDFK